MSRYAQGRRYEYKAAKALREEGYTVIRSAQSKGLWDLTAVRHDHTKLVQVKSTRQKGKAYRDANVTLLEDLPVPPDTQKEIWVYRIGVGAPEIVPLGEPHD